MIPASFLTTEDGLALAVHRWAPSGEVRAVICMVHGLGEHGRRYDHLAAFLNRHGYLVLALDLRGHGRSPGLRGHSPDDCFMSKDIDLFSKMASSLYPGLPVFLYGHSLGGGIVLNYCLSSSPNLAGVVVTGPLLRTAFAPPSWKLALARVMYRLWPSLVLPSELDARAISRDQAVVDAYLHDPLVHDRLSVKLGMDMLDAGRKSLECADSLGLPLLIMHGGEDRLTSCEASAEFAARAGAKCTLKIWPGLYHEIHNEPEQDQVFAFLLAWLEKTATTRDS
ncbi:MAG: lysophospholipase [Smithellaceae bacterium]|nr:lysophospholipase [Smithellaceae bacterium]